MTFLSSIGTVTTPSPRVRALRTSLTGERLEAVRWRKRLWSNARAPFRPSEAGLEVYASCFRGHDAPRSLVLGATPELIDLLVEQRASELTVVDMCQEQWDAIQGFGRADWSSVEWICGDWLEPIASLRGRLDYVCCDGGTLFLEWSKGWRRLFEVAFDSLAPGGVFVTKAQDMTGYGATAREIFDDHVGRFEAARRRAPAAELEHFREMASSLHVALFLGTQRAGSATMDPEPASRRLRQAHGLLRAAYGEARFQPIIDLFFEEMDPAVNPRAVLQAGPPPAQVIPLLESVGFEVEYRPLPPSHAPAPGVCYMLAARRPLH